MRSLLFLVAPTVLLLIKVIIDYLASMSSPDDLTERRVGAARGGRGRALPRRRRVVLRAGEGADRRARPPAGEPRRRRRRRLRARAPRRGRAPQPARRSARPRWRACPCCCSSSTASARCCSSSPTAGTSTSAGRCGARGPPRPCCCTSCATPSAASPRRRASPPNCAPPRPAPCARACTRCPARVWLPRCRPAGRSRSTPYEPPRHEPEHAEAPRDTYTPQARPEPRPAAPRGALAGVRGPAPAGRAPHRPARRAPRRHPGRVDRRGATTGNASASAASPRRTGARRRATGGEPRTGDRSAGLCEDGHRRYARCRPARPASRPPLEVHTR